MKKLLTLLAVLFVYANSYAVVNVAVDQYQLQDQFENLDPILQDMKMDDFLALTPKKYRQMTGKKLGIKKALQLKAAQKVVKKATKGDMDKFTPPNFVFRSWCSSCIYQNERLLLVEEISKKKSHPICIIG